MNEYDIALKSVLRKLAGSALRELTGCEVTRWHNVEFAAVQSRTADMLGETADGELLHIELQSANDRRMATRMLEYAAQIQRQFDRLPRQLVLYVGKAPLRMPRRITGPEWTYSYRVMDIRSLDGDALIARGQLEDNVIAILARLRNERVAVRQILERIARAEPGRRAEAFSELLLLAGLRSMEPSIRKEAKKMPLLNDIMDHKVIGPAIRQGRKEGREEGREEGRKEGSRETALRMVLRLIGDRFGPVPESTKKRLARFPEPKLEQCAVRIMKARTIEDVLT